MTPAHYTGKYLRMPGTALLRTSNSRLLTTVLCAVFILAPALTDASESPAHAQANTVLPAGSRIVRYGEDSYHLRLLKPEPATPEQGPTATTTIVLLSGPAGSWFSDSRFFSALQPALAKHYPTVAIDRPGIGLGPLPVAPRGYRYFGEHLSGLLHELGLTDIVIVGFASANLALTHFVQSCQGQTCAGIHVRGLLLIDPDALDAFNTGFYAEQARDFQNPALTDYVLAGKYNARAKIVNDEAKTQLMSILDNAAKRLIDWGFYETVSAAQLERPRIAYRFAEVALYDADVRSAAALSWPKGLPTRVWNTDFEAADSAKAPDNPALKTWHNEGDAYFERWLGACHRRSPSTEHLATFAEIPALLTEVEQLVAGISCSP